MKFFGPVVGIQACAGPDENWIHLVGSMWIAKLPKFIHLSFILPIRLLVSLRMIHDQEN
jgi:hypothetical protein